MVLIFNKKFVGLLLIIFLLLLVVSINQVDAYTGSLSCGLEGAPPACQTPCSSGINSSGGPCYLANPPTQETQLGTCKSWLCLNSESGAYQYLWYKTYAEGPNTGSLSCKNKLRTNVMYFPVPQSSYVNGCYWDNTISSRCNVAQPQPFPTCFDEGFGGGEGNCTIYSLSGDQCPVPYRNRICTQVPCGYRGVCDCPCDCEGDGSACQLNQFGVCDNPLGGPTSMPTPTPTPYCSLVCPGQGPAEGFGLNGPGSIEKTGNETIPTVIPPDIEGTIDFYGYNGFACGLFNNGNNYQKVFSRPVFQ